MNTGAPEMPGTLSGWLELLERRHPRTIDLGLERCGAVFAAMGAPRPAPLVVTVAGTNGKGSAVAWTCSLLAGLGRRTAAYTSPHLLRFNERLRIDDEEVTDQALVDAFGRVEDARGQVSLTYFEFTTLACLDLIHRAGVDVAVLEVGLGGRLDTVNLVDPDVAIITPIGLDHQEFLGPDRERIGREKAGILRPGIDVVCTEERPPASVLERADSLGCRVWRAELDFRIRSEKGSLRFQCGPDRIALPMPKLAGAHQHANLAAALMAVSLIEPTSLKEPERLSAGMQQVRLQGRLQRVPGDPRLLLDVGHNPLAAEILAEALAEVGQGPVFAVLGMLADKDAEGVARILSKVVDRWYCAGLGGERGQDGETLAARVSTQVSADSVRASSTVAQALASARRDAPEVSTILVFGSFQTVAEAARGLASTGAAVADGDSSDPACC